METCVLLSARRYQFTDDKGAPVQGVTLTYLTGDVETTGDRRGLSPLTINAPVDVFSSLSVVPGVYGMEFKQRPGKNGRPTLQVTGVRFEAALDGLLAAVS